MEDKEVKEYKKAQKFYFTENGQLVVESNKGVWVDGEQFVKMYGNFLCNAKTMGMVIQRLKGIPVEIGVEENVKFTKDSVVDELLDIHKHTINTYCILGVDKNRIEEYCERLAIKRYTTEALRLAQEARDEYRKQAKELLSTIEEKNAQLCSIKNQIEVYNSLPWYKRVFKKIDIK